MAENGGPTMKVLVSDALERGCIDVLRAEGFEVEHAPGTKPDRLLEIIGGYDGLVVRSATKVTAAVIARAERLKVVGRAGTGVDNIDVDAATRRGVIIMNTPGGNTVSTAEHTVSMLLSLARNIPQAHMSLTRGQWEKKKFVVLSRVVPESVNLINAPLLAREMGLRVGEMKEQEGERFSTTVRLQYETAEETREVTGTVFGPSTLRFVRLDGFPCEVRPEGFLLVYSNMDKPGILANVGTVLAIHQVNIAGVSLGRSALGGGALTVMNLDTEIPEAGLEELRRLPAVSNLRIVLLD